MEAIHAYPYEKKRVSINPITLFDSVTYQHEEIMSDHFWSLWKVFLLLNYLILFLSLSYMAKHIKILFDDWHKKMSLILSLKLVYDKTFNASLLRIIKSSNILIQLHSEAAIWYWWQWWNLNNLQNILFLLKISS